MRSFAGHVCPSSPHLCSLGRVGDRDLLEAPHPIRRGRSASVCCPWEENAGGLGAAGGDDTEYDYYMQRLRMFTSRYEKTLLIGDSMGDGPQPRSSCERPTVPVLEGLGCWTGRAAEAGSRSAAWESTTSPH